MDNAIFPYLKKKHDLGLTEDKKLLLIYDVFTGQTTENIKEYIEENDCVIVHVPNNMTHYFQSLDLTVNAVAKHFLKDKFKLCHANEVKKQLDEGTEIYEINILLKLSILKPIHRRWFLGLYDHLQTTRKLSSMVSKALDHRDCHQRIAWWRPVCRFGLGKCFLC